MGAKVGIGVGCGVAACAVGVAAFMVILYRRQQLRGVVDTVGGFPTTGMQEMNNKLSPQRPAVL